MLDKFIKHAKTGSSLVVKAPFSLKVRGSYFDSAFNIDRERNRQMMSLPKGIFPSHNESPSTSEHVEFLKNILTLFWIIDIGQQPLTERLEVGSKGDFLTVERNILDNIIKNLSVDLAKETKVDESLLKNNSSDRLLIFASFSIKTLK